jgi:alkanesulfonate monooxygenase SsuD/methylene tetrahydromethanopterin reductase-like flavin-dependent oxidoreductase (luciferase family)
MQWEHVDQLGRHEPPGVTITFPFYHQVSAVRASKELGERLSQSHVAWLRPAASGHWLFQSDGFKAQFPEFANETWLTGDVLIAMDHTVRREKVFDREEEHTYCQFVVTPEVIADQMPTDAVKRVWPDDGFRLFLSHTSDVKADVAFLKSQLLQFGICCFVAHAIWYATPRRACCSFSDADSQAPSRMSHP